MRARSFSFPSAYAVLLLVIVVCAGITWTLPAGRFDLLEYDQARRPFVAERATEEETLPAEQATLDRLGIQIRMENFENGNIRKPVSIPGTYHPVPPNRRVTTNGCVSSGPCSRCSSPWRWHFWPAACSSGYFQGGLSSARFIARWGRDGGDAAARGCQSARYCAN